MCKIKGNKQSGFHYTINFSIALWHNKNNPKRFRPTHNRSQTLPIITKPIGGTNVALKSCTA